jgi:pimeloyl-ACP methyl ester carboxylesterase
VIPTLQAEGYEVMASQHSLDSVKGDAATVKRTLGRVSSPAILVGHSYGGTVITAAGTDDRVAGLVYIAALAPDQNETSQSHQNQFPKTDVFSYIEIADGRVWLRPDGLGCFAEDLSEQERKQIWATQMVPVADLFDQKAEGTAWKSSQAGTSSPPKIAPFIPSWSASRPSAWAPLPTKWTAATSRCSPIPNLCSM